MEWFEVTTSEDVASKNVETIGEREEEDKSGMLHEIDVQT